MIKDKKKLARVIATWVVTSVMLSVFILDIIVVALGNKYVNQIPISNELFFAQKGKGATLNGKKIHVSQTKKLEDSLLITGFPYNRFERMEELINRFSLFLTSSHDVRRLGSAALDLCWVAAGRADGYWEDNLNPWDASAGTLILQEAGGKVTDYNGKKYKKIKDYGSKLLASNGKIHKQMLGIIRQSIK